MQRGSATRYTPDAALQEVQRRLDQVERQLGASATERPGKAGGRPDQQGRGLYTISHEVDVFPQQAHEHYVMICPDSVELVEAYVVMEDPHVASAVNYSFIRVVERRKADGYRGGRELAYISGQPSTAGEWATGNIASGIPYRFRLSKSPYAERSSLILLDSESTNPAGAWPEAYVLLSYRYRSRIRGAA